MKRLSLFLAVSLMFLVSVPAVAVGAFHYESKVLGISITVPGLSGEEIVVEESESCVSFFHEPSKERWGGLIGAIEVVSPRSNMFSAEYNSKAYRILAMGKDSVFLWKSAVGGVNSGGETLDAYLKASSKLSYDNLKEHLEIVDSDVQPSLSTERHRPYLATDNSRIRPNDPLSRGELAEMLYALMDANNKAEIQGNPFPDVTEKSSAQAVAYLSSYGIFAGYTDGMFHPERPVSRSEFSVLLHRCQFMPAVGRYNDVPDFADVPADYWAAEYIYSANVLGWVNGYADGTFRPEKAITRAEAVTVINRMLGRDETYTCVEEGTNPFSDLACDHWAYGNILEAAGVLSSHCAELPVLEGGSLPGNTSASYFLNEKDGWAVSNRQLSRTTDGGRTWSALGKSFSFTVSDVFFFNEQEGVLLGSSEDSPCLLLQTSDGGVTWSDFLADVNVLALHFPRDQFPTANTMLAAITSAELRPASKDAVYLTVRYQPYESIYALNVEAVKQTVLTVQELHTDTT